MVGPHYSSEQRKFMAIEYAKNQGRRDFMDLIIANFQVRYPGIYTPGKLDHQNTLSEYLGISGHGWCPRARDFEPFKILKGYL